MNFDQDFKQYSSKCKQINKNQNQIQLNKQKLTFINVYDSIQNKQNFFNKNYTNHYQPNIQQKSILKNLYQQNNSSLQRTLIKDYDGSRISQQKSKKQRRYAYINTKIGNQNQQSQQDIQFLNKSKQICQIMQNFNSYKNRKDSQQNYKNYTSKENQIQQVRLELDQQKTKFIEFQQITVQNQMKILNTINDLQLKLKELKQQNLELKKYKIKYNQLTNKSKLIGNNQQSLNFEQKKQLQTHFYNLQKKNQQQIIFFYKQQLLKKSFQLQQKQKQLTNIFTQKQNIFKQYKKVKGIAKGIVDMMNKVDNVQSPQNQDQIKFAWKWVKKIVWEYQGIRKKAFQWKKAYDQLYKQDYTSEQENQSN